jgi:3,4-dihydroxy 2-butanone 4-phosphate synthase/GTP cyclohydrolase II
MVKRMYNYHLHDSGIVTPEQGRDPNLRVYGIGAQILADLGVHRMRVLSAPKKIHGLAGFGLEVVEYVECD